MGLELVVGDPHDAPREEDGDAVHARAGEAGERDGEEARVGVRGRRRRARASVRGTEEVVLGRHRRGGDHLENGHGGGGDGGGAVVHRLLLAELEDGRHRERVPTVGLVGVGKVKDATSSILGNTLLGRGLPSARIYGE